MQIRSTPGISLRTVYTAPTDLVDLGELRAVTLGSGPSRHRLTIDLIPSTDSNHHPQGRSHG